MGNGSTIRRLNGWLSPALFLTICAALAAVAVFVFYPKSEGLAHAREMEYRHKLQDELNYKTDKRLIDYNKKIEILHDNVLLLGERFKVEMIRSADKEPQ